MQYSGKEIRPIRVDENDVCPGADLCVAGYREDRLGAGHCCFTNSIVSKGDICLPAIRAMREQNERLKAENMALKAENTRLLLDSLFYKAERR